MKILIQEKETMLKYIRNGLMAFTLFLEDSKNHNSIGIHHLPKNTCNKCYGRGYDGVRAFLHFPNPCSCTFKRRKEPSSLTCEKFYEYMIDHEDNVEQDVPKKKLTLKLSLDTLDLYNEAFKDMFGKKVDTETYLKQHIKIEENKVIRKQELENRRANKDKPLENGMTEEQQIGFIKRVVDIEKGRNTPSGMGFISAYTEYLLGKGKR